MQENEIVFVFSDLPISFGSGLVLKGTRLTVRREEIIGYIGPSGAGESTTDQLEQTFL
ncbi:hypothetical protein ACLIBH_05705 [Virgibacillus sp. W0430]|uniref:hypothetical protein n=1 Tax=Virgibacillus sp. W0430 TaxID=3391580 RepID=UPI003F458A94